ncbi:hypothetical protein G0T45_000935 [Escherichia coli]|nr:hypothetical protein [Escherichia coli]
MHDFAYIRFVCSGFSPLGLAWNQCTHATALKPPHEAGGRGGESTARWRWC